MPAKKSNAGNSIEGLTAQLHELTAARAAIHKEGLPIQAWRDELGSYRQELAALDDDSPKAERERLTGAIQALEANESEVEAKYSELLARRRANKERMKALRELLDLMVAAMRREILENTDLSTYQGIMPPGIRSPEKFGKI